MRLLLAVAAIIPALAYAANDTNPPFRRFFPTYDTAFQRILRENCSEVVQYYLATESANDNGTAPPTFSRSGWAGAELDLDFSYSDPENFVVECMLNATPELIKSKMATAQVLLGLTPALLALLAPGQHQTGLVAIAAGHPVLAVLLAAGSPTVSVIQSLDYTGAVEVMNMRRLRLPRFFRSNGVIILMLEYLLALASIANVIEVSLEIFMRTFVTFSPGTEWTIFLWSFMGIVIHLLGALAVSSRVKVAPNTESEHHRLGSFLAFFNLFHRPRDVRLRTTSESFSFYVTSWIASVLTVSHILFGSMLFSSILFISVEDSALLLFRLMASVVVCKLIVMYELFYLQGVVTIVDQEEDYRDHDHDRKIPHHLQAPTF